MTEMFDIAVVGAGPAGANAAIAAAQFGKRVVVIDEQPKPGGQVWRAKSQSITEAPETPELMAGDALRKRLAESHVSHRGDTRVWQVERDSGAWHICVLKGGKTGSIMARLLILATGAREFVQPIPGWTTPGVIGLAGATALFKQDLTLPGKRTVVSGTGPLVFFVASEIRRLGGEVAAVITPNGRGDWSRALPAMLRRPDLLWRGAVWVADLMLAGIPILWRHAVSEVEGRDRVTGVKSQSLNAEWAPIAEAARFEADSLCLGHGLIPAFEAAQLAGLGLSFRPELGGWIPETGEDGTTCIDGLFLCGDGGGIRGAAAAEIHGKLAGLSAVGRLGADTDSERALLRLAYRRAERFGGAMTALSVPKPGLMELTKEDTIVCRCESLSKSDVSAEIAAGAGSINAVKSGLRAGMGPCGGKFCLTAVARTIADTVGCSESDVPPPTPRPPLRPMPVSALVGNFNYDDLPIPKPVPL